MTEPQQNACDGCSADLPVFAGAFCDVCSDDFSWGCEDVEVGEL